MISLIVGDRVRFKCAVDRFPEFIVPAGELGVVTYVGHPRTGAVVLVVQTDSPLPGCLDREVVWIGDFYQDVDHDLQRVDN